ncbi:MAG: hypothetical protein IJT23_03515 [Clostridia bacterium]|nr:hypothetical protein [Clostridia bacterium]
MEKRKNLKYGIGVLAYVLLIGLFFTIGYYTGSIHGANMQRELMEKEQNAINTSSYANVYDDTEQNADIEYELSLSGGVLTVSKHEGETVTSIAQCSIAEEVYPKTDIDRLKQGMRFESKKEALSVFEDFVS